MGGGHGLHADACAPFPPTPPSQLLQPILDSVTPDPLNEFLWTGSLKVTAGEL